MTAVPTVPDPADRPIAMFDSGFGGLTVARAVIDLLPDEHLVYFGDTARYPFGSRPRDEVGRFARQITNWLVENHDPKMIVVACNTATAVALPELEAEFDVESEVYSATSYQQLHRDGLQVERWNR